MKGMITISEYKLNQQGVSSCLSPNIVRTAKLEPNSKRYHNLIN